MVGKVFWEGRIKAEHKEFVGQWSNSITSYNPTTVDTGCYAYVKPTEYTTPTENPDTNYGLVDKGQSVNVGSSIMY